VNGRAVFHHEFKRSASFEEAWRNATGIRALHQLVVGQALFTAKLT
jgi:hypothetical protein